MPASPTKQVGLGLSIRIDNSGVYGHHGGIPLVPGSAHLAVPLSPSSPLSARSASSSSSSVSNSPSSGPRRSKRQPYIDQACDFCRRRKKRCHREEAAPGQPESTACVQCNLARRPCTRSSPSTEAKKAQRTQWLGVESSKGGRDRDEGPPSPLSIASPTRSLTGGSRPRGPYLKQRGEGRFLSVSPAHWSRGTWESPSMASPVSSSMSIFSSSPSSSSSGLLSSPSWHSSSSSLSSSTPVSPSPSSTSALSSGVSPLLLPAEEWAVPQIPTFHLTHSLASTSSSTMEVTRSVFNEDEEGEQPPGILLPIQAHSSQWPHSALLPRSRSPSPSPSLPFDVPSLRFDSRLSHHMGDDDDLLPSLTEDDSLQGLSALTTSVEDDHRPLRHSVSGDSLTHWPHSTAHESSEGEASSTLHSTKSPLSTLALPSSPFSLSSTSLSSSSTSDLTSSTIRPPIPGPVPATSTYITAFFSLPNQAWASLLDEASFRAEYDAVHGAQVGSSMDAAWQLCMGGVMAVGARLRGEINYSRYAASLGAEAAAYIQGVVEHCAEPASHAHLPASFSVERLALAFRGLVLLAHYNAAMGEAYAPLLTAAAHVLALPSVAALVPAEVQLTAKMLPSIDAALSSPQSEGGETKSEVASSPTAAASSSSLHDELQRRFPLDRWRYLKLKRHLQAQLCIDDEDEELQQGREWDSFLDVSNLSTAPVTRGELLSIALCVAEATSSSSSSKPAPVSFSVYNCLAVLLRAEASVQPWPERGEVLGLKAACHRLLGSTKLAVKAAQEMLGLMAAWRSTMPVCLSPLGLSFLSSLLILAELDVSRSSTSLLCQAMAMAGDVARTWPRLATVHSGWQRTLEEWSARQLQSHEALLRDCRQSLEKEVLTALNQSMNDLLTAAANHFITQTATVEDAKHKHAHIQQLRGLSALKV